MGADVYAENNQKQTPLMIAAYKGYKDIIRVFSSPKLRVGGKRKTKKRKTRRRKTRKH